MDLILASRSPRRRQLLEQLGLKFAVVVSDLMETVMGNQDVNQLVEDIALNKAKSVAASTGRGVVIGADTLVVLDGQPLGKPETYDEARQMLTMLSGRTHRVITGVAVVQVPSGKVLVDSVTTKVKFRRLSSEEITAYLDTGEYCDKAGAYAIQGLGSVLVEEIEGCYFNVVGLPLARLAGMLGELGIHVLGERNSD